MNGIVHQSSEYFTYIETSPVIDEVADVSSTLRTMWKEVSFTYHSFRDTEHRFFKVSPCEHLEIKILTLLYVKLFLELFQHWRQLHIWLMLFNKDYHVSSVFVIWMHFKNDSLCIQCNLIWRYVLLAVINELCHWLFPLICI